MGRKQAGQQLHQYYLLWGRCYLSGVTDFQLNLIKDVLHPPGVLRTITLVLHIDMESSISAQDHFNRQISYDSRSRILTNSLKPFFGQNWTKLTSILVWLE